MRSYRRYRSIFRLLVFCLSVLMHIFSSCKKDTLADADIGFNPAFVEIPTRTEVVGAMTKANDYFILHETELGNSHWNKAVYHAAELGLFELTNDSAYLFHSYKWAKKNKFSLVLDDGEKVSSITNADKQCCGQAYFTLFQIYKKDSIIADILLCMNNIVNDKNNDYWTWIDALYMSMPVLAETGKYKNDTLYFNKLYKLFTFTKDRLQLYGDNNLWYRDVEYLPENNRTMNGKEIQWSRGNGWVYAALAKTIEKLPLTAIGRSEYIEIFNQMSEVLIKKQREDGFWNRNLADFSDFPGPETSGTALFTYGLAWGINNGLIINNEYWESVSNAWHAMAEISLNNDGFLGYIQPQGSAPKFGGLDISRNTEDFGVGAFLLAGCEVSKLEITFEKLKTSYDENSVQK